MQTLYIDIYFLINFTVDLLAVYFAVIFSGVPSTVPRLLISAVLGSFFAIALLFLPESWLVGAAISVLCVGCTVFISTNGIRLKRRLKFGFAFLIFEALIGGIVQLLYGLLDKFLKNKISESVSEVGNRRLILLALVVLLAIGILKLLVSLFSARVAEGSVSLEISIRGRVMYVDAFCDSGNLAKDPFDSSPVVFVKQRAIKPLFPDLTESFFDLRSESYRLADDSIKKKLRLIPVSRAGGSSMLFGIKPDSIKIKHNDSYESISATVAIDNEGGTYGGYDGLIPAAVVGNAFK